MPRPVQEPREAREQRAMTEEQRASWVHWLTKMLMLAGYAVQRPDRRFMFFWRALSNALLDAGVDVPTYTLVNYIKKGSQPSPEIAAGLSRVLGLHPLSVAYKAGLYSLQDLAAVIGSGQYRSPQALYEELEVIRQLPASSVGRQNAERHILGLLRVVSQMQQSLALSDEEFGGLQAELVKLEIAEDEGAASATFTAPGHPAWLPLPSGVREASQPRSARPGPTRKHVPRPGDEPEE
jgi:hypothetical protein